jgi:hypothetical protein
MQTVQSFTVFEARDLECAKTPVFFDTKKHKIDFPDPKALPLRVSAARCWCIRL